MRLTAFLSVLAVLSIIGSAANAQMPSGPPSVGVVRAQQTAITETSEFVGRIQAIERVRSDGAGHGLPRPAPVHRGQRG